MPKISALDLKPIAYHGPVPRILNWYSISQTEYVIIPASITNSLHTSLSDQLDTTTYYCNVYHRYISDQATSMNAETEYIRSSNLSDKQRQFLSRFTIDPEVQRLIPSSTISESVHISSTAAGLLLTYQPLVGRFYWDDFAQFSQLINGRMDGYVTIFPSGYDYDLTHTLYFVSLDSLERSIPTSELTIPGVELTGAHTFERDELGVFLEAVHKRSIRDGTTKRRFGGGSSMVTWLAIETPSHDYFEPAGLWLNKPGHEEYVASLRSQCSLHLHSGPDIWIRTVGMDWPEYFFRLLSKGTCNTGGNTGRYSRYPW